MIPFRRPFSRYVKHISDTKTSDNRPVSGLIRVQVCNIVKTYGSMINVDVHPHIFQHSLTIHLVRSGLDLRWVQQLLGCSNLNTTQVYLQLRTKIYKKFITKSNFDCFQVIFVGRLYHMELPLWEDPEDHHNYL